MKTMLALALVGLISIISLAEAKKQNPKDIAKIKTVQRDPSSAKLNCPDEFVKIEGSKEVGGDFCISKKKVEDLNTSSWQDARSKCEDKSETYREVFLCTIQHWSLACNQKKSDLGMDEEKEWVLDPFKGGGKVIGTQGCNTLVNSNGGSLSSRCCISGAD
ncbi:MAG: hypothetical protein ACK5WZ_04500 [Pseudobdellovibrionaceae bacterium]